MAAFADGAPCWADAMLPDLEAGKRFYGELLGWTFQDGEKEHEFYTQAFHDGKNVAALAPKPDGRMPTAWTVYLASADAAATARKVTDAGGRLIAGPMAVDRFGTMALAVDPGGAVFGVWQGGTHTGFEKKDAPGTFCWAELHTRDTAAADPFYRSVFGLETKQIGQAGGDFDYEEWSPKGSPGQPFAGRCRMGGETPVEMPAHFRVYFAVDNADEAAATVRRLGGKVNRGPEDSPFGRVAQVTDNQGATFSVIDPQTRVGEPPS